jgi:hypothetical protein
MAGSDPDIKDAIKKALLNGAITGASTEDLRKQCGLECTNKQFSRALGSLVYGTRREVNRESTDPRNPDAEKTIRLTPQGRESMNRR